MTDDTGAERLSEEMALPAPNLPLLRKILDHIDAHPEEWNQRAWASNAAMLQGEGLAVPMCGTAYCIAGHALAMSGHTLEASGFNGSAALDGTSCDAFEIETLARAELGLTSAEAEELFESGNNRRAVQQAAREIAARAGERL